MYQDDIDKFDGTSLSSSCMISVHGLPDPTTEPVLHYPVPLEGVLDPVILFIHKVLQSTIPVAPSNDNILLCRVVSYQYSCTLYWTGLL